MATLSNPRIGQLYIASDFEIGRLRKTSNLKNMIFGIDDGKNIVIKLVDAYLIDKYDNIAYYEDKITGNFYSTFGLVTNFIETLKMIVILTPAFIAFLKEVEQVFVYTKGINNELLTAVLNYKIEYEDPIYINGVCLEGNTCFENATYGQVYTEQTVGTNNTFFMETNLAFIDNKCDNFTASLRKCCSYES